MNWARRRLTSVIEQISMSERRIPYMYIFHVYIMYMSYPLPTTARCETECQSPQTLHQTG